MAEPVATTPTPARPTFGEAFRFWLKLGFISFGGPAGQIAIMHRELVEQRRWLGERQFLHALNYCMLLPGPEAQQLATYAGWLLHGTRGGLIAGTLFVLPSAVILWALSWAYVTLGSVPWVAAIFYGLKPVVLAIVLSAVYRIGKKVLKNPLMIALAAIAWLGLAVGHWPFPLVVIGAGLLGWIGGKVAPAKFSVLTAHEADGEDGLLTSSVVPTWGRAIKVALVGLTVWWLPILAAGAFSHWSGIHYQQGVFFSQTAMVTFGGAYAVLPYVAEQAVGHYGWLSQPQIMDGLGLAETTPGPLIMVLQFVGFVAAWQHASGGSPLLSATLGAAITTWATFAPCFLWIFLGAPFIEHLRGHRLLNAALSAITAAVVGVMLNLAHWFGWHVLWPQGGEGEIDWFAASLATVALAGLVRWKWEVVPVVLGGGIAGLAWRWIAG